MDFSGKRFLGLPAEVVEQLRFFYTPKFWRSQKDWEKAHPKKIAHLATVTIKYDRKIVAENIVYGFKDSDNVIGKFVFMWNNIGRVISPDGKVYYCCFYSA